MSTYVLACGRSLSSEPSRRLGKKPMSHFVFPSLSWTPIIADTAAAVWINKFTVFFPDRIFGMLCSWAAMLSRSTAYDLRCPNVILCSHISGVSRPAELTSKVFLLYVHSWYSGVQKQTLKHFVLCSIKISQIFKAYSPYHKEHMMKCVMVTNYSFLLLMYRHSSV